MSLWLMGVLAQRAVHDLASTEKEYNVLNKFKMLLYSLLKFGGGCVGGPNWRIPIIF